MLYRAETFGSYSASIRDKDGKVMNLDKARDPNKYFEYLREQVQAGHTLSIAEQTLLDSQDSFRVSSPDMISAIEQMKDFGQYKQKVEANMSTIIPVISGNTGPQSGSNIPTAIGWIGGVLGSTGGKIIGSGTSWMVNVVTDMINGASKESPLGGVVVIGVLIAAIWKFGFWKTLGTLFGIGVLSEVSAGRLDLKGEMWKLEKAGASVAATAGEVAGKVGDKTGEQWATKPAEQLTLSESQKAANNKVTWDHDFVQAINEQSETNAKSKNGETKKKTGKVEDYLNFINSPTFQSQKLENLLYTDNIEASIFSNNNTFGLKGIDIPENLDRQYLKRIVRMYIVGKYKISTPVGWIKEWQKEKEEFLKEKKKETYKDKTLAELIIELNK